MMCLNETKYKQDIKNVNNSNAVNFKDKAIYSMSIVQVVLVTTFMFNFAVVNWICHFFSFFFKKERKKKKKKSNGKIHQTDSGP